MCNYNCKLDGLVPVASEVISWTLRPACVYRYIYIYIFISIRCVCLRKCIQAMAGCSVVEVQAWLRRVCMYVCI